eukprot:82066_1
MRALLLLSLLLIANYAESNQFLHNNRDNVQCLDDKGHPVDWWFIYKRPKNKGNSGWKYMYWLPTRGSVIKEDLNNKPSPLSRTIAQMFRPTTINNKTLTDAHVFMAYNDDVKKVVSGGLCDFVSGTQKCEKITRTAHAKGFFAIDFSKWLKNLDDTEIIGYWIIHSQPEFPMINPSIPPNTIADIFKHAAEQNGQHYFCVTIKGTDKWMSALEQMRIFNAKMYIRRCGTETGWRASGLNTMLTQDATYMCDITKNKKNMKLTSGVIREINLGGKFFHFAAAKKTSKPYNIFTKIGQHYGTSFAWQTWGSQWRKCHQAKCENFKNAPYVHFPVQRVFIDNFAGWECTKDHSKIGISIDNDDVFKEYGYIEKTSSGGKKVVCWGDLNRARSQFTGRNGGGGYICTQSPRIHDALAKWYKLYNCNTGNLKEICSAQPGKRKRKRTNNVFGNKRNKQDSNAMEIV